MSPVGKHAAILAMAVIFSTSCAAPAYERDCDTRISQDECTIVTQTALSAVVDDSGDWGELAAGGGYAH